MTMVRPFLVSSRKGPKEHEIREALRANAPSLIYPSRRLARPSSIICGILPSSIESAPRDGYIGKGVSGARERDINAFPMAASFDSFLAETRKE